MAEAEQQEQQEQPTTTRKGRLMGLAVWALVGLISAASGFLGPMLLVSREKPEEELRKQPAFISVGSTVVNLDEGRLNRYLRVSVTLQTDDADKEEVNEKVLVKSAILKDWLLSYLADKSMEDIRGRTGQHRLRREIQDHFNAELFPDGRERIQEVLFEEFSVQ